MKEINQLINVNLKSISEAENTEMYYSDFVDMNQERFNNDIRSKLFAEEMETRGLVKIHKELCTITEKGLSLVNERGWLEYLERRRQLEIEQREKEKLEFEKSKIDLSLNKFLLKTKWAPLFLSLAAIVVSVYFSIEDKNKQEELEKKMLESEKTIDTLRIEIFNLQKKPALIK
jgi:hypothetical protein